MKNKIPQPINNILLQLKEPAATTIETNGGFKLEFVSRYNFEQHVTCTAIVSGVPKDSPYGDKVKKGDTLYFKYDVVADRAFGSDKDYFNPYIEENYRQIFYSGTGEKIQIVAVQGLIGVKYVAAYFDKYGRFVHGCEGYERDIERWKSQFNFGSVQSYEFKNLITYKGGQYWKCGYDQVFAKKKGNFIEAIGDRAILEPIDIELPDEIISTMGVHIPKSSVKGRLTDRAKLLSGGWNEGFMKGDIVAFDERFIERYKFNNKEYYLIKTSRLDGVYKETK